MQTDLGADALNTMEGYRNLCTDEEFKTFENGIIDFDLEWMKIIMNQSKLDRSSLRSRT